MSRFVVLFWLLGLLGCGDAERSGGDAGVNNGTNNDAAPPEASPCGAAPWALTPATRAETAACLERTWVTPIVAAECGRLTACSCPNTASLEGCEDRRSARARRVLEAAQEAEAAGGLRLDPAALERCRAGWIAGLEAGCGVPTLSGATELACAQVFVSEAGVGEPCALGTCAGGAGVCGQGGVCVMLPQLGEACEGVCAEGVCLAGGAGALCQEEPAAPPETPAGEPCEETAECAEGLVCEVGRCASRASSACSVEAPDCGAGRVCLVVSGSRVCVEAELGEACGRSEACPAGASCVEGRCEAAPGLGGPCADGIYCEEGLACRFEDGTCQAVPGEGEACALGLYGPFVCAEELGCHCGAGGMCRDRSCQPLATEGEACAQDGRCAEGLGCVFGEDGTNTCAAPVGEGSGCTNDTNCGAGLYCDYSALACRPWAAFGEACRDGNECGPTGTCAPDAGGAFVCGPLPSKGEACFLECGGRGVCEAVNVAVACAPVICEVLGR